MDTDKDSWAKESGGEQRRSFFTYTLALLLFQTGHDAFCDNTFCVRDNWKGVGGELGYLLHEMIPMDNCCYLGLTFCFYCATIGAVSLTNTTLAF